MRRKGRIRERLSLTCGHISISWYIGPFHKQLGFDGATRPCAARTSLYRLVYIAKWGAAHPLPPPAYRSFTVPLLIPTKQKIANVRDSNSKDWEAVEDFEQMYPVENFSSIPHNFFKNWS